MALYVSGHRCDHCAPGYYGHPDQTNGQCQPCKCNGNIVAEDPDSCDPHTGQCLKCLYNTDGPSCSECKPGYYGNALARGCRCKCNQIVSDDLHFSYSLANEHCKSVLVLDIRCLLIQIEMIMTTHCLMSLACVPLSIRLYMYEIGNRPGVLQ